MMLDIARHGGDKNPVSLGAVASRTDISRGYLEQVAIALRAASLLRGVPGRQGGYRLTRRAGDTSISQIVEALIGPISLVDCVADPDSCGRSDYCECRVVYHLVNDRIVDVLEAYTLADLMDPKWITAHGKKDVRPIRPEELSDGLGCAPAGGRASPDETI